MAEHTEGSGSIEGQHLITLNRAGDISRLLPKARRWMGADGGEE